MNPRPSPLGPGSVHTVAADLDHVEGLNFGGDGACWAGGEDGQLYRITADGDWEVRARTRGGLGGVCLDGDGAVYACNYGSAVVERIAPDGGVTVWSRGEVGRPAIEPNYAAFDDEGFLYWSDSGSYYRPDGRLMVTSPAGRTTLVAGGHLHFPNGLALDASGTSLYVIVSTAPAILRYPIRAPGRLGDPDIHVKLRGVVPDGLAFGASGSLYVACYSPDVILRVDPDGGVETVAEDPGADRINRPTNVAFEPGTTNLWFANFGGHTIGSIDVGEAGLPLRLPRFTVRPGHSHLEPRAPPRPRSPC